MTSPEPDALSVRALLSALLANQEPWRRAKRAAGGSMTWPAFQKASPAEATALTTSIERWNSARQTAQLEGADLSDTYLSGVNLTNAVLDGANLEGAMLQNAQLASARLRGARLGGADLSGALLDGADLSSCSARGARFVRAHMSGVSLQQASLEKATLRGAVMRRADCKEVQLHDAVLTNADCRDANLWCAEMDRVNFSGARLERAVFGRAHAHDALFRSARMKHSRSNGADFLRADFSAADLRGASLQHVDFTNAVTTHARLSGADLRTSRGFVPDECELVGTRLPIAGRDGWSEMRARYTGANLLLTTVLVLLYFAPLVLETSLWLTISRAESAGASVLLGRANALDALVDDLSNERTRLLATASRSDSAALQPVSARLDSIESRARGLAMRIRESAPTGESSRWRPVAVWRLLIGLEDGIIVASIAFMLFVYYAVRVLLTVALSQMRDEEDRSGYTPALARRTQLLRDRAGIRLIPHYPFLLRTKKSEDFSFRDWLDSLASAYGWLVPWHLLVSRLGHVALVIAALRIANSLLQTVFIPA